MALLTTPHSEEEISPKDGKRFTLEELRDVIGWNFNMAVSDTTGLVIIYDSERNEHVDEHNQRIDIRMGEKWGIYGKALACRREEIFFLG